MIKTNVEVITPVVAAEYLRAYNVGNRNPNKGQVAYYAKMMQAGEWELNGESIKFSAPCPEIRLLDGQHRLMACVEANVPFETLVVRDVEEKTFDTLDQGWLRKKGQIFKIADIPNATNIAAAINRYLTMGYTKVTSMDTTHDGHVKLSPREVLEEYKKDPAYWQHIHTAASQMYSRAHLLSQSEISSIIAHLNRRAGHDLSFVLEFFEQLFYSERTELPVIRLLQQRLIQNALGQNKLIGQVKTQLIRKTWDCYKTGKSPAQLKWIRNVEEEQPFK